MIEQLEKLKPLKGVYGNIDGTKVRATFPEVNRFFCENVEVLMIHIGGYPEKYSPLAKKEIGENAIVVATGGIAPAILTYCEESISYDPDLMLKGLALIYKKNQTR